MVVCKHKLTCWVLLSGSAWPEPRLSQSTNAGEERRSCRRHLSKPRQRHFLNSSHFFHICAQKGHLTFSHTSLRPFKCSAAFVCLLLTISPILFVSYWNCSLLVPRRCFSTWYWNFLHAESLVNVNMKLRMQSNLFDAEVTRKSVQSLTRKSTASMSRHLDSLVLPSMKYIWFHSDVAASASSHRDRLSALVIALHPTSPQRYLLAQVKKWNFWKLTECVLGLLTNVKWWRWSQMSSKGKTKFQNPVSCSKVFTT